MNKLTSTILFSFFALVLFGCAGGEPPWGEPFKVLGLGVGGDGCPDMGDGSAFLGEDEGCVEVEPPPDNLPPEEGGCWITGIGTFGKGLTRDSFGGNAMTMKDGRVRGEWQHVDHYDVTGSQKNGQNIFHGKVEYIRCERYDDLNGPEVPKAIPNFANWGGHGRFNGVYGYAFDVRAFDHAEGGIMRDRYAITVYDPDGNLVLEADGDGTRYIVNGPAGSMNPPADDNGTPHPTKKACLEDPTLDGHPELAWVYELGCISGGNFQIHPPNKGHPYENPTF